MSRKSLRHGAGRFVQLYFLFLVLPLATGFVLLFLYDPLQIYHAHWSRSQTLHSNFRLQAAAIIRREPFDGLILGTSMTENTSAEEAGRLFDERMANLSITASDFIERSLILDDIFRRRQIRHVIYTLDHVYIGTRKGYSLYPLPTFDFLYDRNPLNDIRVYLNEHFAKCLLHWSGAPDCVGTAVSLDRPNAWINQTEYAVRFGGISNWCKAKDNYQIRDAYVQLRKAIDNKASGVEQTPSAEELRQRIEAAKRYVDENVLRHVRRHPETRFDFFFPPYFRATYAIWHQARPIHSAVHLAIVRYMAEQAEYLPNMRVSGFETESFPDDIANYKDLSHYTDAIDSRILAALEAETHLITRRNVEAYVGAAVDRAKAFDLDALAGLLRDCGAGD